MSGVSAYKMGKMCVCVCCMCGWCVYVYLISIWVWRVCVCVCMADEHFFLYFSGWLLYIKYAWMNMCDCVWDVNAWWRTMQICVYGGKMVVALIHEAQLSIRYKLIINCNKPSIATWIAPYKNNFSPPRSHISFSTLSFFTDDFKLIFCAIEFSMIFSLLKFECHFRSFVCLCLPIRVEGHTPSLFQPENTLPCCRWGWQLQCHPSNRRGRMAFVIYVCVPHPLSIIEKSHLPLLFQAIIYQM